MRRNVEDKIFFEGAHFFGPKLSTEVFTIWWNVSTLKKPLQKNIYRRHIFLAQNQVPRDLQFGKLSRHWRNHYRKIYIGGTFFWSKMKWRDCYIGSGYLRAALCCASRQVPCPSSLISGAESKVTQVTWPSVHLQNYRISDFRRE